MLFFFCYSVNGDLEKLEIYEQEQEECIEELAQLVQDEDNKHRQLQERSYIFFFFIF